MRRGVVTAAVMLAGLWLIAMAGQAQYYDPAEYLSEYESYDVYSVLDELHAIQYDLDYLYGEVLFYSSATAGVDQAALVELELEVAELEARATALLLHAFRVRYWEVEYELPLGLELEILMVRTKEIYIEIIMRCVVIERLFISVVLKWD